MSQLTTVRLKCFYPLCSLRQETVSSLNAMLTWFCFVLFAVPAFSSPVGCKCDNEYSTKHRQLVSIQFTESESAVFDVLHWATDGHWDHIISFAWLIISRLSTSSYKSKKPDRSTSKRSKWTYLKKPKFSTFLHIRELTVATSCTTSSWLVYLTNIRMFIRM